MPKIALLLAGMLISLGANAGGDALFGLQWGSTPAELKSQGVQLVEKVKKQNLSTYEATVLPKGINGSERYVLVFDDQFGLVKVVMIGVNIEDDMLGSEGKEKFAQLETILQTKYGKGDDTQTTGATLYQDADEFYQCLAYDGCGIWWDIYHAPNKIVSLQLKGLSRGVGYIELASEAVPEFDEALKRKKAANAAEDQDAL